MSRFLLALVLGFAALPVSAADSCDEVAALNTLYGVRDLMIRGASSWTITSAIDEHIERLREPMPGGGYRWIRLIRPENGRGPYDREKHFVMSDDESSPDIFESDAASAYAISVVVPRKRSLFRKNAESWIGDVAITCRAEGRTETKRESIRRWMRPDTSHLIDLDMIADHCHVRVESYTRTEYLDEQARVEIHIRQAVEQDDPDNPNYETVRSLHKVRSDSSTEKLDYEIARLERRLFPSLRSYPFATLLARVQEAEELLRSEEEEKRVEGKELLERVVKQIEKQD